MRFRYLGLLALAGAGTAIVSAQVSGPVARYEMRAGTTSGMAAMRGGMGAMMGMAMGGRPTAQHELWLDLGSTLAATSAPKADHFMPAGARLGVSVPLITPIKSSAVVPREQMEFQRPKGRMLIFWGCGEHAPAGQPVVIDFAKIAAGQMPPGLWSSAVPTERFVSAASSKTYATWPNAVGKMAVKPESSLIGGHRVAGTYSPEMNFTLTRDFMGALNLSSSGLPSGATMLRWNRLPEATGHHASLFGGKQGPGGSMGDIVWWSSSQTREFGGGLTDWLSPATAARLVTNRTLLAAQTTTCAVPAEVKAAAPQFQMATLYAYGPQEDFSFPPRPANLKAPWKLEWSARIRHRSTTSAVLGMPGMDDEESDRPGRRQSSDCQRKPKRRGLGGLSGLLGGALGVPSDSEDGC